LIIPRRLPRGASSLWIVLFFALATRVAYLSYRQSVAPRAALATISFLYEPGNIAYSLATGGGFSSPFRVPTGPTAWQTPVYPLLLAGVFRLLGTYTFSSYLAAVSINILCSVFACIPIYFTGKRIVGRQVGLLAAWLWAIFPNAFVIPTDWIWDTCLSALLAAMILWATLALDGSRRARDWCAYGLLWGLALMTNPTLLSALPFLLGWLAFDEWKRWTVSRTPLLPRLALSLGVMAACCVPWTVRNFEIFHRFIPFRSVLGLQLWLGNNDAYKDHFPGQLHPLDNSDERARYVQLGEVEYMREKQDLAARWILSHPRREADLFAERFVATWAGTTDPWKDFRSANSILIRAVFLANVAAAFAGLAGILILFVSRNPYAFPVAVLPVVFPFVFYFTQALLRYRHPIDPIVMILCAISIAAVTLRGRTGTTDTRP
jgi:4-amino-4-deoxy-L-arabinose transferase-like glycosyltransferase